MKRIVVFVMAFALLAPAVALADTISFHGFQQPGLKVEGEIKIKKDEDKKDKDKYETVEVEATTGEFKITWNEQEVLAAYCTDILKSGVGGRYDVAALNTYDYDKNESMYQAAWVMDNFAPGLGYLVDKEYNSTVAATAVQSAIWNLMTPSSSSSSPWDLTKVKSGSKDEKKATEELYAIVLGEAQSVDFSTYNFKKDFYFGESQQSKQDLLFATNGGGASAPEPGTLLLMGSALTGLWGFSRRRKWRKGQSIIEGDLPLLYSLPDAARGRSASRTMGGAF